MNCKLSFESSFQNVSLSRVFFVVVVVVCVFLFFNAFGISFLPLTPDFHVDVIPLYLDFPSFPIKETFVIPTEPRGRPRRQAVPFQLVAFARRHGFPF